MAMDFAEGQWTCVSLKKSNLRIDRNCDCPLADLIARWPDGVVYVKYVFPSYYNYNTLYDMTLQLHTITLYST